MLGATDLSAILRARSVPGFGSNPLFESELVLMVVFSREEAGDTEEFTPDSVRLFAEHPVLVRRATSDI